MKTVRMEFKLLEALTGLYKCLAYADLSGEYVYAAGVRELVAAAKRITSHEVYKIYPGSGEYSEDGRYSWPDRYAWIINELKAALERIGEVQSD